MPLPELESTDDNKDDSFQSTFNDELPIDRPDKSATFDDRRAQSENEKLAETIRNAQNPAETVDVDDESLTADENLTPVDENTTADENLTPIDENISAEENLPPIDENISADENLPPIDENISADENLQPIDENISADENLPPIDENISADENLQPIDENISADEKLPPVDENISADENLTPVDENIPVDENLQPLDENIPVDENLQPLDENITADENLPPLDEQLLHEQAAQFGFTPEQLAQAQAMMFAQFNQYQMAMAQMQMQAQAQAQAQVAEMAEQMRERHRRRMSTAGQAEAIKTARMTPEEKKIHNLENEVARMKNLLSGVMGRNTSPNSVTLREALTYQEVDEDILDEMETDASIGDTSADILTSAARLTLSNYIEEHLKFSGGIKLNRHGSRIVAVLGTTGVGKTTTLAKIAAKFVLEHKIEPVLVTADTFRISAVDQLKTYSEILGLPLEIVYSPAELSATIDKHKDRELILIDTAGRSRQSFQQMQYLKDMLSVHSRIEKHLVVSATTKITDARDMVEKFSIVEPEKLIVTKIDETGTLGLILNLLKDRNLMLSYFTTGQGVPEDIEVANVNVLTDLFLKKIVGE